MAYGFGPVKEFRVKFNNTLPSRPTQAFTVEAIGDAVNGHVTFIFLHPAAKPAFGGQASQTIGSGNAALVAGTQNVVSPKSCHVSQPGQPTHSLGGAPPAPALDAALDALPAELACEELACDDEEDEEDAEGTPAAPPSVHEQLQAERPPTPRLNATKGRRRRGSISRQGS